MAKFTGAETVRKHQSAMDRCKNEYGWDLLKCIVDELEAEYGTTPGRASVR